eukprot:m.701697 g.701697  ORF g.701697 m.701697 type:complete len:108 (+) comp22913_c1_seq29:224-547(+)
MCEIKDTNLLARLLYPNPVCVLSTLAKYDDDQDCSGHEHDTTLQVPKCRKSFLSCMTISWLSPTDNGGGLMCSISKSRFTGDCLHNAFGKTLEAGTVGKSPVTFYLY